MDRSVDHDELHNDQQSNRSSYIDPLSSDSSHTQRRPGMPSRASTLGSPGELDRSKGKRTDGPHARSDDLNHTYISESRSMQEDISIANGYLSRFPPSAEPSQQDNASTYSSTLNGSFADSGSGAASGVSDATSKQASSSSTNPGSQAVCGSCQLPLEGPFVRALGDVWHLQCFKCKVCILLQYCLFCKLNDRKLGL